MKFTSLFKSAQPSFLWPCLKFRRFHRSHGVLWLGAAAAGCVLACGASGTGSASDESDAGASSSSSGANGDGSSSADAAPKGVFLPAPIAPGKGPLSDFAGRGEDLFVLYQDLSFWKLHAGSWSSETKAPGDVFDGRIALQNLVVIPDGRVCALGGVEAGVCYDEAQKSWVPPAGVRSFNGGTRAFVDEEQKVWADNLFYTRSATYWDPASGAVTVFQDSSKMNGGGFFRSGSFLVWPEATATGAGVTLGLHDMAQVLAQKSMDVAVVERVDLPVAADGSTTGFGGTFSGDLIATIPTNADGLVTVVRPKNGTIQVLKQTANVPDFSLLGGISASDAWGSGHAPRNVAHSTMMHFDGKTWTDGGLADVLLLRGKVDRDGRVWLRTGDETHTQFFWRNP